MGLSPLNCILQQNGKGSCHVWIVVSTGYTHYACQLSTHTREIQGEKFAASGCCVDDLAGKTWRTTGGKSSRRNTQPLVFKGTPMSLSRLTVIPFEYNDCGKMSHFSRCESRRLQVYVNDSSSYSECSLRRCDLREMLPGLRFRHQCDQVKVLDGPASSWLDVRRANTSVRIHFLL